MIYSIDLRERVLKYVRERESKAEAARRYGISKATVYTRLKREKFTTNCSDSSFGDYGSIRLT
ncbi:MAG: IS630 transposase-related protein [Pseudanabaenaceae cyanobacterium]|jgi:transposase